jgi:hypothetical protein
MLAAADVDEAKRDEVVAIPVMQSPMVARLSPTATGCDALT